MQAECMLPRTISQDQIMDNWDAVIIGSGAGGLTTVATPTVPPRLAPRWVLLLSR